MQRGPYQTVAGSTVYAHSAVHSRVHSTVYVCTQHSAQQKAQHSVCTFVQCTTQCMHTTQCTAQCMHTAQCKAQCMHAAYCMHTAHCMHTAQYTAQCMHRAQCMYTAQCIAQCMHTVQHSTVDAQHSVCTAQHSAQCTVHSTAPNKSKKTDKIIRNMKYYKRIMTGNVCGSVAVARSLWLNSSPTLSRSTEQLACLAPFSWTARLPCPVQLNSSPAFSRSAEQLACLVPFSWTSTTTERRTCRFRQHDTQNERTPQNRDREVELAVTNPKCNSKYQAQKFNFFSPFFLTWHPFVLHIWQAVC
jgi:hypothetical protein